MKCVMSGGEKKLAERDERKHVRLQNEINGQKTELKRIAFDSVTDVNMLSSSDKAEEDDDDRDTDMFKILGVSSASNKLLKRSKVTVEFDISSPLEKNPAIGQWHLFSLLLLRHKVHKKSGNMPMSVSSIQRVRAKHRSKLASDIKTTLFFNCSLVIISMANFFWQFQVDIKRRIRWQL